MLPGLQLKLIAALIILALIGFLTVRLNMVKGDLEEQTKHAVDLQARLDRSQADLLEATSSKEAITAALAEAAAGRARVQAELQSTLKRFRNQRPPTECKAAIDWAIQQRGDLSW